MRFFVGTSGYSYKEWKGSFYPERFPANQMLSYYAQRFSTVEINKVYVFFKHEETGTGPKLASRFLELLDGIPN